MLRTTTTTTAAYGVLAIFLLLLSVSQGVPVAGEVEETPVEETTVLPTSTASVIKVANLTFADSIRNPCPTDPSVSSKRNSVAESTRMEFAIEFYKTVRDTSRRYQQDFQEMLNSSLFQECPILNVGNLQNIPSLSDLQTMSESDALEGMYSSILLHTAYAYFVRHQLRSYSKSCFSVDGYAEMLNRTFQEIATKQKYLACFFHMGATVMGYSQNFTVITEQVLDETMTDLQMCRRHLRDCQVLKSTINLLGVIKEYSTSRSQNRRTFSSGSSNLPVHISSS